MKKFYFITTIVFLSLLISSCSNQSRKSTDSEYIESVVEDTTYEITKDIEWIEELSAEHHEFSYYLLEEFEKNYEQLESLYGADYTAEAFSALEEINAFLSNLSNYTYTSDIVGALEDLSYYLSPTHFE